MAKKDETKELQEKLTDLENQLKRAVADYRNLENRISQGRLELASFMGAELIEKLLPVLDHLEKALAGGSPQEKQSGWFRGVELAVKEFKNVLLSEGLEEIIAEGQFDPSLHEAVDTRDGEDNTILEVVRKGYNLNGKVIRPSGVVVGKSESRVESQESRQEPEKQEEKHQSLDSSN